MLDRMGTAGMKTLAVFTNMAEDRAVCLKILASPEIWLDGSSLASSIAVAKIVGVWETFEVIFTGEIQDQATPMQRNLPPEISEVDLVNIAEMFVNRKCKLSRLMIPFKPYFE